MRALVLDGCDHCSVEMCQRKTLSWELHTRGKTKSLKEVTPCFRCMHTAYWASEVVWGPLPISNPFCIAVGAEITQLLVAQ